MLSIDVYKRQEEDEVEEAQKRFEKHKRQQKTNLIINFSVPNTREDILEFMILASSNIDVKKGIDDEVSKAWQMCIRDSFYFVLEHHLNGKVACKKVGVRPIHVWWSVRNQV